VGWILVICCIPAVPLLFIEFAVPAIRRALAKKATAPTASADGPYRESPVPTDLSAEPAPPAYAAAWARYRRLRLIAVLLFVGWVPGAILLQSVLTPLVGPGRAGLPIVGWWLSIIIYMIRWGRFRCPRCRDTLRDPWVRKWLTKCHSCGLPIFALTPDDYAEPAPARFDPK
jgi:hypothetical protein